MSGEVFDLASANLSVGDVALDLFADAPWYEIAFDVAVGIVSIAVLFVPGGAELALAAKYALLAASVVQFVIDLTALWGPEGAAVAPAAAPTLASGAVTG